MPKLTGPLRQALWVSADVTLAVGAITMGLPERWHGTLVGGAFLAAAWLLVWRHDDDEVRRSGLALGGLVIPGRLRVGAIAREAGVACAWGLGLAAIVAVPFFFGWRAWWARAMPRLTFSLAVRPIDAADELLAQLLVIALPEEAFYRGYLQTRLDDYWPPRWRVLGARVGPGLLVGAAIFALGHVVTVHMPTRLAVFFPALLFGWLRARTGGIGASVVFHAACNIYSQALGRGYGVY
ncbi:MAG TPA: MrtC family glutamic-type intramembrane protease [Polyangiaceae bacterium]|nr:MrtC family glutamic-type intramembrane protease [Polyangiaceae bacterium]